MTTNSQDYFDPQNVRMSMRDSRMSSVTAMMNRKNKMREAKMILDSYKSNKAKYRSKSRSRQYGQMTQQDPLVSGMSQLNIKNKRQRSKSKPTCPTRVNPSRGVKCIEKGELGQTKLGQRVTGQRETKRAH